MITRSNTYSLMIQTKNTCIYHNIFFFTHSSCDSFRVFLFSCSEIKINRLLNGECIYGNDWLGLPPRSALLTIVYYVIL